VRARAVTTAAAAGQCRGSGDGVQRRSGLEGRSALERACGWASTAWQRAAADGSRRSGARQWNPIEGLTCGPG
jgi:hypothetical protein